MKQLTIILFSLLMISPAYSGQAEVVSYTGKSTSQKVSDNSYSKLDFDSRKREEPIPDNEETATLLNTRAIRYYTLGNYAAAEPLYLSALAIANNAGSPELLYHVQNGYSQHLIKTNQPAAATLFGKMAVNTIQQMRATNAGLDKGLQSSFLSKKEPVYRHLADLLIDQGRIVEAERVMAMLKEEELFDFIRRDVTQDSRQQVAQFDNNETPWAVRYNEISSQLVAIGGEMRAHKDKKKLGLSEEDQQRLAQLDADIKVVRKSFLAAITEIKEALGQQSEQRLAEFAAKRVEKPRKLQQTLRQLGHNSVALYYLITEDKLRIILTTPEIQVVRDALISEKELNHLINAFRTTLIQPTIDPRPQAQELYQYLIAPVAEDLKQANAQTLMISLDGALRYLPIAALYDDQHYVAENYQLSLYNLASVGDVKDKPSPNWQVIGLGLSHAVQGFAALAERYPVLHIASHFNRA